MPRISKRDGEQRFANDLANAPQGIGATRTNLQRLLHSLDFIGWSKSEESGRLDRRALTKFATGSVNVFSRRQHIQAETSAVSVLIDCSGSMKDGDNKVSRIQIAQQVTVHLSKMLQQARVPFAVTGFRNGNVEYLSNGGTMECPHFLPFKPWGKTLQQSLATIGSINESAQGGTPDYTALANAIDELAVRPEHRRILFIITDAEGYQRAHMEHLQRIADKVGVTIVAIGIQSYSVTRCFVNAVSVSDLSDLGKTAFNQLLKAVQRKAH
jgi:cobalamin biosynthesis protein CobT